MSPVETGARRHLVLVGLMGAGKTTVGARCAERLGRAFVDTDDLVVAHAAMPVDEIFRTGGEARFRELERQVVADVCASPEPLVIGSGGGAVVDADNRRRFRAAGVVVWLHAPTEVLAERVGTGSGRPLLTGESERAVTVNAGTAKGIGKAHPPTVQILDRLAGLRDDAYRSSADAVVETGGRTVDAVADAVLAAFAEAAGVAS